MLELAYTAYLEVARTMAIAGPIEIRDDIDKFLKVLLDSFANIVTRHDADAGRKLIRGTFTKIGRDDDLINGFVGDGRAC